MNMPMQPNPHGGHGPFAPQHAAPTQQQYPQRPPYLPPPQPQPHYGQYGPPPGRGGQRGPWTFLAVLMIAVAAVLGGIFVLRGDEGSAAEPTEPTTEPTEPTRPTEPTEPTTPPTEPGGAAEALASLTSTFAAMERMDCEAVLDGFTDDFLAREYHDDCDAFLGEGDASFTEPELVSAEPMVLTAEATSGGVGFELEFVMVTEDGAWLIDEVNSEDETPTTDPTLPTCGGGGLTTASTCTDD